MAQPGETVMLLVGRIDGVRTEHDGRYVAEYDPTLSSSEIVTERQPKLVTTADIEEAIGFRDPGVAFECWRQVCPNYPVSDDRRPNRPLTVYTCQMFKVPQVPR